VTRLEGVGLAVLSALLGATGQTGSARAQNVPAPSAVQTEAASGVISYPPEFFADANPTTAVDMVRRVPGFTLIDTEQDVRGLSGATGNVLIDGQLPSAKSVRLSQFLQRIPAATVERIDLVRGGAPGIDMQGQPVVVNVIRRGGAYSTQAIQSFGKFYPDGQSGGLLRFEAGRNWNAASVEGSLSARMEKTQMDGGEGPFSLRNAAGTLLEEGDYLADYWTRNLEGALAAELDRGEGMLRLSAAISADRNTRDDIYELATTSVGPVTDVVASEFESLGGEVSAAYQRPLSERWSSELLLIQTYERETQTSEAVGRRPTDLSEEAASAGETIGRGTLVWQASETAKLEFLAEGAFNTLDVESARSTGGVPVILPVANVLVEERRGEIGAIASLAFGDAFDLEAAARFETSTITLTGDAEQEKTLSFFKPSLLASWDVSASTQLRLRLEREVGQLDFEDFAASTDISDGVVSAGNPDLEPETADVFELAVEHRFWERGAATLTLRHEEVQSVVDLIPIDRRFDAPGNIGDGTRDAVSLSLNVPLDRLGVSGGLVRFTGTRRWSSVRDPVTGEDRRISGERPFEGMVTLSRDVPAWRSSFVLEGDLAWTQTSYRLRQIQTIDQGGWWKLYWDWTPRPDLAFRFQIENFTSRERVRTRTLYAGPRDAAGVSAVERREARFDPFLFIRVRKTF